MFGVRDHADDDENADKLKEKAEMAIQAKGWLSNAVPVLYTVRQQKTLVTWMSLLIMSRWISSLPGAVSQTTRLFQREINEDGVYSQYIWAEYKNRRS